METLKLDGCFNVFTNKDDKNIAYHVSNDKNSVNKAREELALKYNFDINNLKYMDQIHSNDVEVVVDNKDLYKCDGLITNKKDIVLMVMVADCIPILFFDKVKGVIGVVHAGRNGTFLDISSNTIKKMKSEYFCEVKDIEVLLGPSIQKCCYEVSQEMADIVNKNFGKEFSNGRYMDLQGINKKQLISNGIKEKNIKISTICTKCSGKNYFSYRLDNSCGRFAGIISI